MTADRLREALREPIGVAVLYGLPGETPAPVARALIERVLDAILAVLPEHRDDVLALLGDWWKALDRSDWPEILSPDFGGRLPDGSPFMQTVCPGCGLYVENDDGPECHFDDKGPCSWVQANAPSAALRADNERLRERCDNFDGLVDALDRLLACYRSHGTPSGRLLDTIAEFRRRRAALSPTKAEEE